MKEGIESQIRDILKESEYSFENWHASKRLIKNLCEDGVPNSLRLLIWKYIAQGDILGSTHSTPASVSPSNKPLFHHPSLHTDCERVTQDYNLLNQIKSFEERTDTAGKPFQAAGTKSVSPFMTTVANGDSPLDQTPSSSLSNSGSSVSTNESGGMSNNYRFSISVNNKYSNLTSEMIAMKLALFVSNFCTETKREYSIDVVKLLVPFTVLSILSENDSSNTLQSSPQQIELNWMSLSISIIDIISNSGIHSQSIGNQILLCESEMFRILLLYHDPTLSYFLDQRSVFTTSYFYEWINHMFCGCIDIKFLIQLWDILLLHQHQDLYLFFSLALLISKKEYILSIKGVSKDILLVLEEKDIVNSLSNQLKLPALIKNAEFYRSITPITFIRNWNKFYTYCKDPSGPKIESIKNIYNEYKYSICMGIDVEELILSSNFGKDAAIRDKFANYTQEDQFNNILLFVFDCRPYRYYKCGKFPSSFHLPPSLLVSEPEEFERVSKSFIDMKGNTHFTFYDNWFQFNQVSGKDDADTNDNGDMNMNILRFLKEGFPYVSRVPSGYKRIHDIFLSKGMELAVHLADKCPVCNPELENPLPKENIPKTPPQTSLGVSKEGWFSKFAKFGSVTKKNPPLTPVKENSSTDITPKKSAFESFKEKLKITSKENLFDYTSSQKKDDNLIPPVTPNENDKFINQDPNQPKKSFYLPNLLPFNLDCEDDSSYFFEEGKSFYYFLEQADSEYFRELEEKYKDYLNMADPVYESEKVKQASDSMDNELIGQYKGVDEWLDGNNLIFECDQVLFTTNQQQQKQSHKEHRYIVITTDSFISLLEHPKCAGYVKIDFQYELEDIRRIVTKKNNPNLLEFRFKDSTITGSPSSNSTPTSSKNPLQSLVKESNDSIDSPLTPNSQNLIKKCYLFKDSIENDHDKKDANLILQAIQERTSEIN